MVDICQEITLDANEALAKLAKIHNESVARQLQQAQSNELRSWMIRRKTVAALWVLGASYSQLGMLYGVTRPTIRDQVLKEITPTSKRVYSATTLKDRMSFDAVSWYREKLDANQDKVAAWSADQLVNWLLAEHPYTGD